MYLMLPTYRGWATRYGEARSSGLFLMLCQPPMIWNEYNDDGTLKKRGLTFAEHGEKYPIRAIVRSVQLSQFGHFMSGRMKFSARSLRGRDDEFPIMSDVEVYVEGTYGNNGLIRDVPMPVYNIGTELPADLREKWARGDGWNSAGSEGPDIEEWAFHNMLTHQHIVLQYISLKNLSSMRATYNVPSYEKMFNEISEWREKQKYRRR